MRAAPKVVPITVRVQIHTAPVPVLARWGQHWVIVGWNAIETVKAA